MFVNEKIMNPLMQTLLCLAFVYSKVSLQSLDITPPKSFLFIIIVIIISHLLESNFS